MCIRDSITHDQEEAINMSDRIVVMKDGRFEQIGTPDEIYNHPKTSYVADFVGNANVISGVVQKVTDTEAQLSLIHISTGIYATTTLFISGIWGRRIFILHRNTKRDGQEKGEKKYRRITEKSTPFGCQNAENPYFIGWNAAETYEMCIRDRPW